MTATVEPAEVQQQIARIDRLLRAAHDRLEDPSVQERTDRLLDERFALQHQPREAT